MLDKIDLIPYDQAVRLIKHYHYAKIMPRITRFCVGGVNKNRLVAVCTLGYGVRPLHTIRKCFPDLGVEDYLEVGRLCLSDELPRNTESFFIAGVINLIKKNYKNVKVLYSWSDGIIGKPGYVYQASNFYYGGYIWTEMYLDKNGIRVHPRTLQGISIGEKTGKFKSRSYEVAKKMGLVKYFGKQFRYVYPMCSKKQWKKLLKTSPFKWERSGYPKTKDCVWKVQTEKGKRIDCGKPPFVNIEHIVKRERIGNFNNIFDCGEEK